MTTVSLYNHTRKLFANGEVVAANLKVMLTNNYTFAATETAMTNATAAEVDGGGWTTGGEAIGSGAVTVVNTNEAMLDGSDISVAASGANIGPADGAVIYETDNSKPLFYIDFEGDVTAVDGVDNFEILWNANGIHRWTA